MITTGGKSSAALPVAVDEISGVGVNATVCPGFGKGVGTGVGSGDAAGVGTATAELGSGVGKGVASGVGSTFAGIDWGTVGLGSGVDNGVGSGVGVGVAFWPTTCSGATFKGFAPIFSSSPSVLPLTRL